MFRIPSHFHFFLRSGSVFFKLNESINNQTEWKRIHRIIIQFLRFSLFCGRNFSAAMWRFSSLILMLLFSKNILFHEDDAALWIQQYTREYFLRCIMDFYKNPEFLNERRTYGELYLGHLVRNFACIFCVNPSVVNSLFPFPMRFSITLCSQPVLSAYILYLIKPSLVWVRLILNLFWFWKSSLNRVCRNWQEK